MHDTAITLATALLRRPGFEGFCAAPYVCPAGYWTIGYGSRWLTNGQPVTARTAPIDQATADSLLLQSVKALDVALSRLVRVALSDVQRAALLSWQYNVGTTAVESSTLLRKLNAGYYTDAADELLRWDKATVHGQLVELDGLKSRRGLERAVFLGLRRPTKLKGADV
ncbi:MULTISPECIES: lysozyme [Gluconobacter]|uniref:Lysozyme n=1 Tax=Gluconobacter cadivus TaxID=2728101 RepID=A0ABR9YYJ8_9PROT|nr:MULTISPECIES: lysozyme [Gluconobacter]MBF0889613.1 lysozyme [Gluconobacter cadivus]MBS1057275.1 lysozyme [Gluconobacter kondonii]